MLNYKCTQALTEMQTINLVLFRKMKAETFVVTE